MYMVFHLIWVLMSLSILVNLCLFSCWLAWKAMALRENLHYDDIWRHATYMMSWIAYVVITYAYAWHDAIHDIVTSWRYRLGHRWRHKRLFVTSSNHLIQWNHSSNHFIQTSLCLQHATRATYRFCWMSRPVSNPFPSKSWNSSWLTSSMTSQLVLTNHISPSLCSQTRLNTWLDSARWDIIDGGLGVWGRIIQGAQNSFPNLPNFMNKNSLIFYTFLWND